jgi:hypothetical protein
MKKLLLLLTVFSARILTAQTIGITNGDFENWEYLQGFTNWKEETNGTGKVQKVTGRHNTGNAVRLTGYKAFLKSEEEAGYGFFVIPSSRPNYLVGYVNGWNNDYFIISTEVWTQGQRQKIGVGGSGKTPIYVGQPDSLGWRKFQVRIDYDIHSSTDNGRIVVIEITSLNGDASWDDISLSTGFVGIVENDKTISIAPNPTSGLLKIGMNNTAEYYVFNMIGQKVAEGKTEGQIDLTNLPSGTYQLILNTEEGISTHKIQKL